MPNYTRMCRDTMVESHWFKALLLYWNHSKSGLVNYPIVLNIDAICWCNFSSGHKNLIALSATKISAKENIRGIDPSRRKCYFKDENQGLKMHRHYSQSNCVLECSILFAQNEMKKSKNTSCTPWSAINNHFWTLWK